MMQTETLESATTIYCPRCGDAMLVAEEHLHGDVACPHCRKKIFPARIIEAARKAEWRKAPPPQPPNDGGPGYQHGVQGYGVYSWRNRWIAGALGILLGWLGVHRFYLGFTGIGVLQIIASILTLGVVGSIWGFVEGVLCFCGAIRDIDGKPLSG